MPYEEAMTALSVAIAREGPAWIVAAMVVVAAAVLLAKGVPTWTAYMDRRAAVEEEAAEASPFPTPRSRPASMSTAPSPYLPSLPPRATL